MTKARKVYNIMYGFLPLCAVFALALNVPAIALGQDIILSSPPEEGNLVIWGCAARQSTRTRELELALEDAAWKAALFCGVKASRGSFTIEENVFPGFSSSEEIKIVPARGDDFSAYKSALRYNKNDMRYIGNSVFLRCVYPAKISIDTSKIPKSADGKKPDWIKTTPQNSDSFVFVRGFAGKYSYTNNTLAAAYQQAIIAIDEQKITYIESRNTDYTSGSHSFHSSETLTTSAATIASFFVLEIFIDGTKGDVWVLSASYNPAGEKSR